MPESLSTFSSVLELILNIIEFSALVISIITFFYVMLSKFSKALKFILKPLGFRFTSKIKVLFKCRNSVIKKRAFIEYALLKTSGHYTSRHEWKTIINEFEHFYYAQNDCRTYNVQNCTCLIDEKLAEAIEKYFSYFEKEKVRKAFGIKEDIVCWVIKIVIEEAYVTPTCLLTGLLSKYEENWSEFIKRYISTPFITDSANDKSGAVLSNEFYMTCAWLLWGPSFELSEKNYRDGMCQISYGDESNSVQAIAFADNVKDKLFGLLDHDPSSGYGVLITPTLSIHSKKPYLKLASQNISHNMLYFYNKVENNDMPFALQIDDFSCYNGHRSAEYYCTAYLWVLFELDNKEHYDFMPQTSVAFFEHTNIADKETLEFLSLALINKVFTHFKQIFDNPEYAERKYRFVCGMNSNIEKKLIEEYERITSYDNSYSARFKERLIIHPKRPASEAFIAFDEYFSTKSNISIVPLYPNDQQSVSDLGRFYTDVYMDCFPDENERETFDNLLKYLNQSKNVDLHSYHIILAKDDDQNIVGGAVFDYFKKTNTGIIEFIAVKSAMQSEGLGTVIYNHIIETLSGDAFKNRKKESLNYIFCEIESPELNKTDNRKYVHFWNKHKYMHIDFDYIQPELSQTQHPVNHLWLIAVRPDVGIDKISSDVVIDVLYDYMKYCMSIDEPSDNPVFQKMKKQLSLSEETALKPILPE